jgi:hypothetical protein
MPTEQEPIKIEIPVEEEEVVMKPERRAFSVRQRGREHLSGCVHRVTDGARSALKSERRRQARKAVKGGVRRGVRLSQRGTVRGLRWMSNRLANVADHFTPLEKNTES